MEFRLVDPDKLKVTLTAADLEALGLDYDRLDYSDESTRQLLISLLEKGRAQAGFHPRRAKLYIEAFPSEDGGCVLYYTRLTGGEVFPAGRFAPGPAPVVLAFSDPDILLRACAQTARLYAHRILKSALYKFGSAYRLVVYPLDYTDSRSASFLAEYGEPVGEGSVLAAYVEEHGEALLRSHAIEALAKLER